MSTYFDHLFSLLHREEQRPAVATSSAVSAAHTTRYNGQPSFEFVGAPSDCYERQRAFDLVASNMLRQSQVSLRGGPKKRDHTQSCGWP